MVEWIVCEVGHKLPLVIASCDNNGMGFYSRFFEKRNHKIRQGFTVAIFFCCNICCIIGLPSANTKLNAYIMCILLQIVIQDGYFSRGILNVPYKFMYLLLGFFM